MGWIGVDFDGTIAMYGKWKGPDHAGAPIPAMVHRVKVWLAEGRDVRIFTARVYVPPYEPNGAWLRRQMESETSKQTIDNFCLENFGRKLPITCTKDFQMEELWDDRAIGVIKNTGETWQEHFESLLDAYKRLQASAAAGIPTGSFADAIADA